MTSDATPNRRPNYSRPTRFPARLAVMLTQEQRDTIDAECAEQVLTLGEVTRRRLDAGEVYGAIPEALRADVHRLAVEADVSDAEALERLVEFAVRESRRRVERNARLAVSAAIAFAETTGMTPDEVSAG